MIARSTILITYSGKMGGTKGIAAAVDAELRSAGLAVTLLDAADVESVDRFDAVVLGSSLYVGRWRPDAMKVLKLLVGRNTELGHIPLWLFQSGPCGDGARTQQVPSPMKVRRYAERLGAGLPITFGGRLDPTLATGFIAKRMATGALAGDFRDFDLIRSWAHDIAADISRPAHTAHQ